MTRVFMPSMAAQRLTKLRGMSPRELAHRVAYGCYCTYERAAHRRATPADADRLLRVLADGVMRRTDWKEALLARREGAVDRFYPSVRDRVRTEALFSTTFRREAVETARYAQQVLDHRFEFFGRTCTFGDTVFWNADPVSGREWPRAYHRDVPIHRGGEAFGDVKDVWELNRHQFLVDLAKAWFLARDPRYAEKLLALVCSWIDDNPYGRGVNWSCALEPAFRTFSWLWAYHLCADVPWPQQPHLKWLASFADHGRFLYRHLEHFASPYNHLIGEAAALYMLGVLFPEFREAGKWRSLGRQVLEARLGEQFDADGASVEQSIFYHHATVGFYLLAACLGRVNGEEFSSSVWRAIERAIEFSMHLQQPDGTVPSIGGADDGKPLRMEHLPFWDFRFIQAIGAVLFDRTDFKRAAGRFFEDALWLLGPDAHATFERIEVAAEAPSSVALERSGYYILRTGAGSTADYLCFDCGYQAGGLRSDAIPSAAHGHSDCLSVILWLGGRPVLVDPGLYSYNGSPAWVEHFRRTSAHSTIQVDAADQAEYRGRMAWARTYRARTEHWQATPRQAAVTGWHDGYERLEDPVRHTRTVWLRPSGYAIILDELSCSGDHRIDAVFQFAPGAGAILTDDRLLMNQVELRWRTTTSMNATVSHGGRGPDEGWVARSLGVRAPAPRLGLSGTITAPGAVLLWIVADLARGRKPLRISWPAPDDRDYPSLAIVDTPCGRDLVYATGFGADSDSVGERLIVWELPERGPVMRCTLDDLDGREHLRLESRGPAGSVVELAAPGSPSRPCL